MAGLEAVYYPNFEPPRLWLRAFLLFFDKLKSLVPNDSGSVLSADFKRFADRFPDMFQMVPPRIADVQFDPHRLEVLSKAFEVISRSTPRGEVVITFKDEGFEIKGNTFIHNLKMSTEVRAALYHYRLIYDDVSKLVQAPQNFSVVNRQAADLIVSEIVGRLADTNGWHTVTDRDLDFSLSVINGVQAPSSQTAQGRLVAAILRSQIPAELSELSLSSYAEIRRRYEGVREHFLAVVNELAAIYRLNAIHDEALFAQRLGDIVDSLQREVEAAKSRGVMKHITRWGSVALGQIALALSPVTLPKQLEAVAGKAVSAGFEFISDRLLGTDPDPRRAQVFRMIGKLRGKVIERRNIEQLLNTMWPLTR
jgi:hypothetical protein